MRQSTQTTETGPVARLLWIVLSLITLWRVWAAWALPITRDEAYYLDWARSLAWGYFDHPPGVALLGAGTLLSPTSAFAGRLGILLAATLTLFVLLRLYRSCGLRGNELVVAMVVASATMPGLASGVLATPDTALGLCWALAMHECLAALRGKRHRWLSAGAATGLGLLSKYTMVLVGPVFLWALLWADPKALRTRWPYMGGLLALLVFAPNLVWNAENDWLTIRFQFGHGFSTETGSFIASTPLPVPIHEPPVKHSEAPEQRSIVESGGEVLAFLGTQVALWGLVLLPVVVALARRRGRRSHGGGDFDRAAKALLVAGSLFPLAFFAVLASFSEVEPNWPGAYLLTAAPLVGIAASSLWVWVLAAGVGNLLLASLYVVHGATGALPLPDSQQRILRETHGYRQLAKRAELLPGALFGDRYQIAAMIRFYAPSLEIGQWPGITRPSEYLRRSISLPPTLEQMEREGGFWLVSRRWVPPQIPGFRLLSHSVLFDCMNGSLVEVPADAADPCRNSLHRWGLFHYGTDSAQQPVQQ